MNDRGPSFPRPNAKLSLVLAGAVGLAVVFLAGPSGLVSIWTRTHRARHLEREVADVRTQIEARSAVRARLANPDSAGLLARKVLGADSSATPDTLSR